MNFVTATPASAGRGKSVSIPAFQLKSKADTAPPVPPQRSVPVPNPNGRRTSHDQKGDNSGSQPHASSSQRRRNIATEKAGLSMGASVKHGPVIAAPETSNTTYIVNNHFYLSGTSGVSLPNGVGMDQMGLIPSMMPNFPSNANLATQQNGDLALLFQLYQHQQDLVNRNMMMAIMGMSQTGGRQALSGYQMPYDA